MQNRIKQLREENHMTQVRLGIELEVSHETISAYEKQKHYPSFAQLLRLTTLFHASIDYIMGLSDIRTPTSPAVNGDLEKLMALGQRMDKKQLELVLAYCQGMLDCPQ